MAAVRRCCRAVAVWARGQIAGHVLMNGREVFKHAVRQMGELPGLLAELGVKLDDVDWVVPHQANVRILEAAADALGVSREKVIITVKPACEYQRGDDSAGVGLGGGRRGKIKRGQDVVIAGIWWPDLHGAPRL